MRQLNFGKAFIRHELTLTLALVVFVAIPLADVAGISEHRSDAVFSEILASFGFEVHFPAPVYQEIIPVYAQKLFHNQLNLLQFCLVRLVDACAFPVFVPDHIKPQQRVVAVELP